jgi:hypothetical protein
VVVVVVVIVIVVMVVVVVVVGIGIGVVAVMGGVFGGAFVMGILHLKICCHLLISGATIIDGARNLTVILL